MGLFGKKKEAPAQEPVVETPKAEPVAAAPVEEPVVEAPAEAEPVVEAPVEAEPIVEAPAEAEPVVEEAPVEEPAKEEVPVAEEKVPEQEAPAASCAADAPELTCKEQGEVFKVSMKYHAGYDQYNEWPNGGKTIHAGIGWFHPFGPSRYYGIQDCGEGYNKEAADFPKEKFFTEDWMKQFETDLFCIYRLDDGDIYAWDGMFAVRGIDPGKCVIYNSTYTRQDVLINVIVGGTGRYEGARGLMIGTAEGAGDFKGVTDMPDGNPLELPATIMKNLEGYIRIPVKE